MNGEQLLCAIACDCALRNKVIGVYPRDRIPYTLEKGQGMIVNTDRHDMPGSHWVCLYIDMEGRGEFMDSYGHSPGYFNRVFEDFLVRNSDRYSFNSKRIQDAGTKVCGHYCLYYFMHRLRGVSMIDIFKPFSRSLVVNDAYVYSYIFNAYYACFSSECSARQSCLSLL